jgi:hypothetical protein
MGARPDRDREDDFLPRPAPPPSYFEGPPPSPSAAPSQFDGPLPAGSPAYFDGLPNSSLVPPAWDLGRPLPAAGPSQFDKGGGESALPGKALPPGAMPAPGRSQFDNSWSVADSSADQSESQAYGFHVPASLRDAPPELVERMRYYDDWAKANQRDARRDAWAFWGLKIPAIVASASAGICAYFQLTPVSVIGGGIATFCVIVDGVLPRGLLRNTHLRAVHDLRNLVADMVNQWETRSDGVSDREHSKRILSIAHVERQRIAQYIRDAEVSLKYEQTSSTIAQPPQSPGP